VQAILVSSPNAPAAPRDFTAMLIDPEHRDYAHFRRLHTPNYPNATTLNIIALAWVNPVKRKDESPFTAEMTGMSIVSLVNDDGSVTPVTTVVGSGCTALTDAPPHNGTYKYQVATADTAGIIGDAIEALEPVVIAKTWPTETPDGGGKVKEEEATPPERAALAAPTRRGEVIDTRGKQIEAAPKQHRDGKHHAQPEKRAR
jgi:hypothetical protein